MTQVIIGDILPYTQATAILNQTVFGTNWTANAASDVVVYKTPSGSSPNDVTQILMASQYSISFVGDQQQVQVTLVTPSAAGDIITITRQTPADRENLYTNTNFVPTMLNNDFGILTLVDQQNQLVNQRIAPRYNYTTKLVDVVDTILPLLAANQFWVKNSSNTGFTVGTFSGAAGSGTINSGSINQLAWFAANGTTLSGLPTAVSSVLVTDSLGVPSLSTTLPLGLTIPGYHASTLVPITQVKVTRITATGAGTYTPTVGMAYVVIQAQAGGGSGGSSETTDGSHIACAGGGSGGEYVEALFTAAQIGVSKAYSVGAGGAAPAAGNNAGNVGGNTTFNTTFIITTGGSAGGAGPSDTHNPETSNVPIAGGTGGSVATGTLIKQCSGGNSGTALQLTLGNGVSGFGGDSGSGSSGGNAVISVSGAGNAGNNGSGGSGAMTANGTQKSGGAGGNGFITFIEYISV